MGGAKRWWAGAGLRGVSGGGGGGVTLGGTGRLEVKLRTNYYFSLYQIIFDRDKKNRQFHVDGVSSFLLFRGHNI